MHQTDKSSIIFKEAVEWGKQLLRMTGDGYAHTCPITPYIHLMIYHVPVMLQTYETMKIFTDQGKITTTISAAYQHCFSLTS